MNKNEIKIEQFKLIFEKNWEHKMTYPDQRPPAVNPNDGLNAKQRYVKNNPNKIKAQNYKYRNMKTRCNCGLDISKYQMKRHLRTPSHYRRVFSLCLQQMVHAYNKCEPLMQNDLE